MPRACMTFFDAFWDCVDDFRSVVTNTPTSCILGNLEENTGLNLVDFIFV